MKRLACLALLALTGCGSATAMGGDRNGVAVEAIGRGADPAAEARAHCGQFARAPVLARTELTSVHDGRAVYYFDCR